MLSFLLICIFCATMDSSWAGTKCAIAKGKVNCSSDPTQNIDAEITLVEDDLIGLFQSNKMGWTTSDEFGHFRVEGCGYDFMSDPDPYVKIYTKCNDPKGKYVRTRVNQTFTPETIDYGTISLD